jgi:(p)ppGpp synthase/HD superfamily hydrolase
VGVSGRFPDRVCGFPKTQLALAYADLAHAGQRRAIDGAPFVYHPIEVASILYRSGAPDRVIAAGALHDTLEKTSTQLEDLERRFGRSVAAIVLALTEDARITDYDRRKKRLGTQVVRAGRETMTVFAADKISKTRELEQLDASEPLSDENARKLAHYGHCLTLLEQHLADSPLVGQLRSALARRRLLAAGPADYPLARFRGERIAPGLL